MSLSTSQARDLATSVMVYIVERPELVGALLAASGLRVEDLRDALRTPELGLSALDFIMEDDTRVLDAAEALAVRPQDLMSARIVLAGPGAHGWDAE